MFVYHPEKVFENVFCDVKPFHVDYQRDVNELKNTIKK